MEAQISAILAVNFLGGGIVGYLLGSVRCNPSFTPLRSVAMPILLYTITVGCAFLNILLMQIVK